MQLLSFQLFTALATALAVRSSGVSNGDIAADLTGLISRGSTAQVELKARWSTYNAPNPAVVVNVTNEKDVAAIVKYCTDKKIPFLAQNGGIAWANTFNLGSNGVLINLAALNAVTFSSDKNQATIGGGASIGDVVSAANAAGALVLTGNCNCVGAVTAVIGGGYGNLMGELGFGVDNIISLRVVLASGDIVDVSKSSNPDLFWAMRGAGPNFGIVTSLTLNSQPATTEDRTAFTNTLSFTPDQLEQVAQAVQDLPLTPSQRVYMILTNSGAPHYDPTILVTGFLRKGTQESGLKAFAPIYALGPVLNTSMIASYDHWNDGNIEFCARGDRKPAYSTTINNMQAKKWPQIWDLYKDFQQTKGFNSTILVERYNLDKALTAPSDSVSMNENLRKGAFAQAVVIPWYTDAAYDADGEMLGSRVRALLAQTDKPTDSPTYANFAHGDESEEAIYGPSLPKLKQLKKQFDPNNAFNQWFNIKA